MKCNNKETDRCDCTAIHTEVVDMVSAKLPKDNELRELASLFKVLGDGTRIKIINALLAAEMCVCDIAVLLNMTKSAISHQLRTLRQTKLVKSRKEGKHVFYSLDDEHVSGIITQGLEHIAE